MYDSDELRALAKAAQTGSPIAQYRLNDTLEPETVLELLDEIERLRKDAERYRWATHIAGNADMLHSIVLCHEGDQDKINKRIDSYRSVSEPKEEA